jgi:hypothetical protein
MGNMKKRIFLLLVFVLAVSAMLSAQSVYEVKHSFDPQSVHTMEDAFRAAEKTGMWGCDDRHFVYAYDAAGSYYRSVASTTEELFEKLNEIDFFDPMRDARISALMGPLPVTYTEDLSALAKSQEELDKWVGRSGADIIRGGFEVSGYFISDSEAQFSLYDDLFEYEVTVMEKITESEIAPDSLFATYTIRSIRLSGPSTRALDI